jgi:hypothetical protein
MQVCQKMSDGDVEGACIPLGEVPWNNVVESHMRSGSASFCTTNFIQDARSADHHALDCEILIKFSFVQASRSFSTGEWTLRVYAWQRKMPSAISYGLATKAFQRVGHN